MVAEVGGSLTIGAAQQRTGARTRRRGTDLRKPETERYDDELDSASTGEIGCAPRVGDCLIDCPSGIGRQKQKGYVAVVGSAQEGDSR